MRIHASEIESDAWEPFPKPKLEPPKPSLTYQQFQQAWVNAAKRVYGPTWPQAVQILFTLVSDGLGLIPPKPSE